MSIKTGEMPNASGEAAGWYASGTTGDFVTDPTTGVAIIAAPSGRRIAVTWPIGWTGRSTGSEVEVFGTQGKVVARTGTQVSLMGGYWYVDGSFLTCGPA